MPIISKKTALRMVAKRHGFNNFDALCAYYFREDLIDIYRMEANLLKTENNFKILKRRQDRVNSAKEAGVFGDKWSEIDAIWNDDFEKYTRRPVLNVSGEIPRINKEKTLQSGGLTFDLKLDKTKLLDVLMDDFYKSFNATYVRGESFDRDAFSVFSGIDYARPGLDITGISMVGFRDGKVFVHDSLINSDFRPQTKADFEKHYLGYYSEEKNYGLKDVVLFDGKMWVKRFRGWTIGDKTPGKCPSWVETTDLRGL